MVKNLVLMSVVAAGLMNSASAGFQYSATNPSGNDNAGKVTDIYTTYDDVNEQLTWQYTIQKKGGNPLSNGFWLAVNNGPNPKASGNGELAIFYGDLDTGTLTAYEYNGLNNSNSWSSEAYLGSFGVSSSDNGAGTERTVSFSIDVSGINAHKNTAAWTGAAYDNKIGYWFHPVRNGVFTYNGDGTLNTFSQGTTGWYDYANQNTSNWDNFSSVPEPSSFFIIGSALLGGVLLRRRNRRN